MTALIPVSGIVPTRNRRVPIERMLHSLSKQSTQPLELIIVDASKGNTTEKLCQQSIPDLQTQILYHRATEVGAAVQRNQAITYASQDVILFCDDDILFEQDCLLRLWAALQSDPELGGVNAMITNQCYLPPGRFSALLFQFLNGEKQSSYAGQCLGPALNILPEDRDDLPEIVPVEWLNTTCTLYRRAALQVPPFPCHFIGYSLMEDVTLSLIVGKTWKLANARTAHIFHDSQPGEQKSNPAILAKMELVNRHYVMTKILHRQYLTDYFKLIVLQIFGIAATLKTFKGWTALPVILQGKLAAIYQIIFSSSLLSISRKLTK